MSEQVRCVAFDNEGCYHGDDCGVKHYLHDAEDGFGDVTIVCLRDPPHSIDLAKDDGHSAFTYAPATIHKIVNEVYSLFVRSPKQFRGLRKLIDEGGVRRVHYSVHHSRHLSLYGSNRAGWLTG